MTATYNSTLPWTSGEFDIAPHRGPAPILNSAQLIDDVEREVQRTKRSIESRFVVVLMHVDGYARTMNERGGRATDLLVRSAAESVAGMLGLRDAIGIMGGGTVAVLLETARLSGKPRDFAAEMAGEMKRSIADSGLTGATISVGIAKLTAAYMDASHILEDAHIALNVARSEGPDNTAVFHFGMAEAPEQVSIAI